LPRRSLVGFRALRGLGSRGPGRLSVPPAPYGVSTPVGVYLLATLPTAEAVGRPSLRFRAPSETCLPCPAKRRRLPVSRSRPAPCRAMLPLLGFRALRHLPAMWNRIARAADSNRHRVPRPGFGYPPRDPHHLASRRRSAGASLGFTLHGVPLARGGFPLSGIPALLTLPGVCTSRRSCRPSKPPSGPRSHGESVLSSGGRSLPTVAAILGFSPSELSPHPPGVMLVVASPALSPFGGVTSRSAWTTGLRGSDGSAWPVSGLPALLGFRTFRLSGHSVHRAGRRAHGFASRGTSLDRRDRPRSKPPRPRRSRSS
jgi:hypothetical protein